ncbi:MAG: PEP/pyruvate-binding domain-containing protein [Agriterribacter sp.]
MIWHAATYNKAHEVGGKAKGLYMLRNAGYNVPDFFVVTANTFEARIQKNNPKTENPLQDFTLSDEDKNAVSAIIQQWNFPHIKLAVRSSIEDEDGAQHSSAGIMDSFLHIDSISLLFEKIVAVAASAYSARATAYRREKKITNAPRPAVIVQIEIPADISGVMFSTWPQYPQELAIHTVNGFGDQLMNGDIQADEYYILKKKGVVNRKITRETAGKLLSDSQLAELYNTASVLEQLQSAPQDIEFVYSAQALYIVQCRPITAPIPTITVYDNSNIQESYCGVTTPLTFSFAQKAYATVYTQTMQALHLPNKQIAAHEDVVNNLLGLINGRVYYNINNWYKGLLLLPSFRQNKADMERMMGVQEPVDFVEDRSTSFLKRLRLIPQLAVNLIRLLTAFKQLHKTVPAFLSRFQEHYTKFYADNIAWKDEELLMNNTIIPQQLSAQLQHLDEHILQQWSTPIVNDFYVMMSNGRIQRLLKRAGINDVEVFISHYLSGNQDIASAQPSVAMHALSSLVVRQPHLHQLILLLPVDIHKQVVNLYPDFFDRVKEYIALYGDRTIGELKLETVTMREDSFILYKYLKNIVITVSKGNVGKTGVLKARAEEELEKALSGKGNGLKKKIYAGLHALQAGIQYREAMRLERTRLFGMYRHIFITSGKWLYKKGTIANERDIFYVELNEIKSLLNQNIEIAPMQDTIAKRKKIFQDYELIEMPSRIEVPSPPLQTMAPVLADKYTLYGTGCVPGMVRGEAIVVNSTDGNLDVHDKIIVAERTDPGWAVLFPACKAVLISKGSSLSHSVILLREFGIPAVINIPDLTKYIKTGMYIAVDGSSGEIKIETNAEN